MRIALRNHLARTFAALVTLLSLVSCGPSGTKAHSELRIFGDPSPQGTAWTNNRLGVPVTLMTFQVCSTGPPVPVTGVRLTDAHGLTLVDWASRRVPPIEYDALHYGLIRDVSGFTRRPIAERCNSGHPAAFDISVRASQRVAYARGYVISYAGGSLSIPFRVLLCAARTCPSAIQDKVQH